METEKKNISPGGFFCPRCGNFIKFDPTVFYHCNPDAFPTRRTHGFLCYNCHAVIFVCENGTLDVMIHGEELGKGTYSEGEIPKFDSRTGKPLPPEIQRSIIHRKNIDLWLRGKTSSEELVRKIDKYRKKLSPLIEDMENKKMREK